MMGPNLGMIYLHIGFAKLELRVLKGAFGIRYRSCSYAPGLHQLHHFFCCVPGRPLLNQPIELLFVFLPALEGGKFLLFRPIGITNNPAEGLPLLVAEHSDCAPAVIALAAIDTMRGGDGVAVTVSFHLSLV